MIAVVADPFVGVVPDAPAPSRAKPGPFDVRLRPGGYIIGGTPYPRVSSILAALPRPWLATWTRNQVIEHAVTTHAWRRLTREDARRELRRVPDRVRDDAAERGTRIHQAIQALLTTGEIIELPNIDEAQSVERVLEFIAREQLMVRATECTVWSNRDRYAGTFDLWAERDGQQWLLDWKTGTGAYAEHALQIASYMHADFAMVNGAPVQWGPGRTVDRAGIVHVRPDGCTLYPIVGGAALIEVFRALIVVYRWTLPSNMNGLGKAEPTPTEDEMAIVVSQGEGRDYPPHPEGQYAARCIDIVDLGMLESTWQGKTTKRHRGILRFWCGELTETNELLWIDKFVTLTLNEKGKLRPFLENWRGKKFTAEELNGFDLEVLIGKDAYLQIGHNVTPEKVYANIDSIMKLPNGVAIVNCAQLDYVRVCDRTENGNGAGPHDADDDDSLPF